MMEMMNSVYSTHVLSLTPFLIDLLHLCPTLICFGLLRVLDAFFSFYIEEIHFVVEFERIPKDFFRFVDTFIPSEHFFFLGSYFTYFS